MARRGFWTRGSARIARNIRISDHWPVIKLVLIIAAIGLGVLMMIMFGFPLIEDLIKGVDPAERYAPKVEKEFSLSTGKSREEVYEAYEMYLSDIKTKNDPYISGDRIIFTTRTDTTGAFRLDAVAIYQISTGQAAVLENVEKKYDNLLSPMLVGDTAVWIDSLMDGGGRIVGYDLQSNRQFVIKEYGYAIPTLSVADGRLAFMQWAGEELQRLYLYDLQTREAVTVRLYEGKMGNSAADISASDMVWSEYREENGMTYGTLKRVVFEGDSSRFANYSFGDDVFEPKTNGKDIVYKTSRDIGDGELMLSSTGGSPVKIAENVLNYEIGETFVAYTKDDAVYVCFTNQHKTVELTKDITKNLLVSVNGNSLTYYDITDGVLVDEVVKYVTVE